MTAPSSSPTHFAALPSDVLTHIVNGFLPPESYVPLLLTRQSPFRPIFRSCFNRLSLTARDAFVLDVNSRNVKLGERNNIAKTTYILHVFGPYIQEICFPAARLGDHFLHLVAAHCTSVSVKKLIITVRDTMNPIIGDILHQFSPNLTDLSIYGRHMPGFMRDSLRKCRNLRNLYVETGLLGMWEFIGGNLQRISLHLKREDDHHLVPAILSQITEQCPNLARMYSPQIAVDESAFFRFILSYGHRLNGVSLGNVKNEYLKDILRICPNLNGGMISPKEDWQRLTLLADTLEYVSARFNSRDRHLDTLSDALASCRHLVSLRVFPSHDEPLHQMGNSAASGALRLRNHMSQLKTLSLIHCVSSVDLLDIFAKMPNLESLDVKLTDTLENGSLFQPAFSQLPQLRRVRLIENMNIKAIESSERSCSLFGQFVESVAVCKRLEILQFVANIPLLSNEAFRTICTPLRVRNVFCTLFQGMVELRRDNRGRFSREIRRSLTFFF